MKLTQVYWLADKNDSKNEKPNKENPSTQQSKINVQNAIADKRSKVTDGLKKAQAMISRAPHVQQFLIGGATGWTAGFISSKVGKTAAIVGGGSILLIVGANQAGLVNINWNKFGKQMEETGNKLEAKVPAIKGNVTGLQNIVPKSPVTPKKFLFQIGKYARANTYFAAGFIGGFLLGIAS